MTPRQLTAGLALEARRQSRRLIEAFTIQRIAAHGEKKDVEGLLKDLGT